MNEETKHMETSTVELSTAGGKTDKIIWAVYVLLCVVSVVEMFSAMSQLYYAPGNRHSYFYLIFWHAAALAGGGFVAWVVSLVPVSWYDDGIMFGKKYKFNLIQLFWVICVFLLIMVFFIGVERNEARRWLDFGIEFQPSELAKLSVVMVVAYYLSRFQKESEPADQAFKPIVLASLVFFVLIAPENLSGGILILAVPFIMMLIGRVSFRKIIASVAVLALAGGIYFAIGAAFSKQQLNSVPLIGSVIDRAPTHFGRVKQAFGDDVDKFVITDKTRQIANSKIAIANGVVPKLPGGSTQRNTLSYCYSDFIFSILVEETGIAGALFVIMLYLVLLYRAGVIAYRSETAFPALLAVGLAAMIAVQTFISMAVCVDMPFFPTTGQPLPVISHGKTSIVVIGIYFGILLSLSRKQLTVKIENDE